MAGPGEGVSIFPWELGPFGVEPSQLYQLQGPPPADSLLLSDEHPGKALGAWEALQVAEIRRLFEIPEAYQAMARELTGPGRYACIHLRQADYLNVASYLIPVRAYLDAVQACGALVDRVIILSDAELPPAMLGALERSPADCAIYVGGPPHLAHAILRGAAVAFCANSQFSLTAAILSPPGRMRLAPRFYLDPSAVAATPKTQESLLFDHSYWQLLSIREEPLEVVASR
jgi:hypothetical protein